MKVAVTGATGFVGRHLVAALLARGHEITAVARNAPGAHAFPWRDAVNFVACDVHDPVIDQAATIGIPDVLVHLAWPGLPNYKGQFHLEQNLPGDYRFIKQMVVAGTGQVMVTGTCFEYGMQEGQLTELAAAMPGNAYAIAKNSLRASLQALQREHPFVLQWARLFYLHGPGQHPGSVLAQLDQAIDEGKQHFDMSGGEQLRDYLPIEEAAGDLASLIERPQFDGIINCCSGKPISIKRLVEERIAQRGADIALNLGHYPYPDHEPFAFWGCRQRLDDVIGTRS
ncbi:MAG: NAD(P)-dependent oxidoreductase [Pseudomonadota bacterium]|nr:NAD(P)-dependent oxidoreductase [Pseudomonadota bacterium]